MGMWQGMLEGLKMVEEEKRLEREREERRAELEAERQFRERQYQENREFREREFAAQREDAANRLRISQQQLGIEMYPLIRSNSDSSSELAQYGNTLAGIFGADSALVDTLISSGDVEGVGSIVSSIQEGYRQAEEQGRGAEFIESVRVTLENDATIEAASVGQIDQEAFQAAVGLSLEEVGLPSTYAIPGSITAPPIVYQPTATIEDLNRIEERIAANSAELARDELQRNQRALAQLTEQLQSPDLRQQERDAIQADQALIGDRMRQIQEALDAATGDNASYFDLLGIYGNSAVNSVLEAATVRVDRNDLSPSFSTTISSTPIAVSSPAQMARLYSLGILKQGDQVFYNGRIITPTFRPTGG